MIAMELIKKMLSIPVQRPLTNTQRFTFVSATIAYIMGGLSMTFAPDLWNMALLLDLTAAGRGYFILFGAGLVVIGLCFVVLCRNQSSQIPNQGPMLGTVASRVLIINAIIIIFYTQEIINARFGLLFSTLDSALAILTYIIWTLENKDASFIKFLQEIWATINLFSSKPLPYTIFQTLGYAQFIISFTATSVLMSSGVVPHTIHGSHTEGMLRCYFATMTAHALLQIYASGSRNDSFPIASIFYRVIWNIPVFFLLAITSQIPRGLANILIIYDVIFIVVTVVLFAREHRVKTK